MNVFFPNREVGLLQLMNLTLAGLAIVLFVIDHLSGVYVTALVATTMLATTLIPARLLGLKWLKRLESDLLQIARNGKWLGIWTCLWFGLYSVMATVTYYGLFDLSQLLKREMVLLSAAMVIFMGLLLLSNKWSYEHVKWWKQINMLIWLVVPFIATHLFLTATMYADVAAFWATWVVLGLIVLAGVSGVFRVKRDYFAFWRIWLLVIGGALSALVVVLYPAIL
jgi:hypothetical protein